MRTQEQQEKNLHIARSYAGYDVTQAIRTSGYGEADRETMTRIINARYEKDALRLCEEADTAVREYLQDIIEETYYGKTQARARYVTARNVATPTRRSRHFHAKMEKQQSARTAEQKKP